MKKILCLIITFCLCLCAPSCSKKNNTAEEILGGIMKETDGLPEGKIYRTGAEMGENGFLSPDLVVALYGKSAENKFALIKDYAIYLSSFATPCEIAVFICYSSSDAIKIERMCRERADMLLVAMRESDICDTVLKATVVRKGRTVAYAMTEDPIRTEKIIKDSI